VVPAEQAVVDQLDIDASAAAGDMTGASRAPSVQRTESAASGSPKSGALIRGCGYPLQHPRFATRLVEVVFASVMLILTAPVMLVIAWLIHRDTPGPALFRQTRVGLGGKPFRFVKFRTLYVDAKTRFPELYAYRYDAQQLQNLKFKIENDPRVTPMGRWLRQTSLDELPNLWNVLTGDVALVGPRPEIPEMLPYYKGEMLRKFAVRPGVTGMAQVSGRGRLGFYETVDYDVEYARTRSLLVDLRLLLKTVRMVILRDGAF
jgi:lipopolysaccharide/colanic/teichoic acid biosynthesis glycosyltransferase